MQQVTTLVSIQACITSSVSSNLRRFKSTYLNHLYLTVSYHTMRQTGPAAGSWRGVLGSSDFPAEPNRYHLYVGLFCPFAHRVMLTRELKGLQDFLPMSNVRPYLKDGGGWRFPQSESEYEGSTVDHLFHSAFLHDVYFNSPPLFDKYEGKYSVPVLWDKKRNEIVNNESGNIMRQLNTAFNDLMPEGSPQRALNFYPENLRQEIDSVNSWLVPDLAEGVYKAGFAPDQESYEPACKTVFAALDKLVKILKSHGGPFILHHRMTEVDIKDYTALLRFDTVYCGGVRQWLRGSTY
jgi:putative glutathione S-transferase